MTPMYTAAETARVEALLDRIDPPPAACSVPGCRHEHWAPSPQEDVPALAA